MIPVLWTPQAADDLQEIHDFIARDSEHYARVVIERLLDRVEELQDLPRSGRVVPEIGLDEVREIVHGPHRIVYRLEEEVVRILTVFRASRLLPPLPE